MKLNEEDGSAFLCVIYQGRVIGTLSVWKKPEKDTFEIGYIFNHAFCSRGLAALSVKSLAAYLSEERKAHRLYGEMDAENRDSAKLLERCGFVKEAHFRRDCFSKGRWTDTLVYALLEEDYRGLTADKLE